MKVFQIGISGALLVLLASCTTLGSDGKRIDYGAAAKQVPTLDVPPDLTAPGSDERYMVPQGDGEVVATFSDYTRGGVAKDRVASSVLPEVPGVRLERNATQRLLVVSDNAENVWSVVKAFFLEIGLVIKSEDQAAGVMETDWAENRAKIPQSPIRSVLGKVFDKAYTAGERDQYLARLEHGDEKLLPVQPKGGSITSVYITHRGLVKVYSPDMTISKWQARASDPELEAIMLQRLMVRFGVSESQAASAVAESGTIAASGVPTISTTDPAGTASLREVPGGSVVIVMNDPFDRSWRKVGLAIESSALVVEDKDRDKGTYFLLPVKIERSWWDRLKFWKASADDKKHYRVNVKDGGFACEVSVTDQDGANSNVTRQMTEAIYKNINQ